MKISNKKIAEELRKNNSGDSYGYWNIDNISTRQVLKKYKRQIKLVKEKLIKQQNDRNLSR